MSALATAGRRFAGLVADGEPLRTSAHFRRLWLTSAASALGSAMTAFAVTLQVFRLTGSSAAVGAVALAAGAPAVVLGLAGGVLVDAVDRRRLALLTTAALAAVSATLAVLALAGSPPLWSLYALVAVQSLLSTVDQTARRTFVPRLLPPAQVPAAAALTLGSWHLTGTAGPALAGVLAGAGGLAACYLLDTATFTASLCGVARLPPMPPLAPVDVAALAAGAPAASGRWRGARSLAEGLRFVVRRPVLGGVLLADLNATVLAMPFALFPAVNAERFGGSPATLGLLGSAVAAGGVAAAALSGPVRHVQRHGLAVLVASAVWGACLAGFGLVGSLAASLALLAAAGAADAVSVVFRASIVQVATPDHLRGRVGAIDVVVGAAAPSLGNARAGAVAALTTPGLAALTGGLSTVVGAGVLALALPALRRYRAPAGGRS